jgi:hypothetical protein
MPTPVDPAPIEARMPPGWTLLQCPAAGEHELRLLGEIHGVARAEAARAAEGWDGFRFAVYTDRDDSLAVIGLSVWDSPEDAAEFAVMFAPILAALHGDDRCTCFTVGNEVRFATGLTGETARRVLTF